MEFAPRIERFLSDNLGVNPNAAVRGNEFGAVMAKLSNGRVDAQVTEEIYGEMLEAENPPTWRRFPLVFIEAVQRIEGKLLHLEEQIRQAESLPPLSFPELSSSAGQEYLIFRALQLAGAPQPDPLFEFEQNGKTGRLPFSAFRNFDALLRGYNRSAALQVRLLGPAGGAPFAQFEVWPAETGNGSRAPLEKALGELGPNASVFLHVQAVRWENEYASSVQLYNAENVRNMKEMRGEFLRIRQNIREVFPANVVGYDALPPMRVEAESAFDFQNTALTGYKLVELSDAAQRGHGQTMPSIGSYTHFPPAGSAIKPSFSRNKLLSDSNVPPPGSFADTGPRPPMNLSPFAASFAAAPAEAAVQSSNGVYAPNGLSAPWNPQLTLISRLMLALALLAALGSLSRTNFLPLTVSLAFAFWHQFRNDHPFYLKPLQFLYGVGVCAALDVVWLVAQARGNWMRGRLHGQKLVGAVDRLAVVLAPAQLALEGGLLYLLLELNKRGVYAAAAGALPDSSKKAAFNLVL